MVGVFKMTLFYSFFYCHVTGERGLGKGNPLLLVKLTGCPKQAFLGWL